MKILKKYSKILFYCFAILFALFLGVFYFINKPQESLVQGFPKIPIYPGAKLTSSNVIEDKSVAKFGIRYNATWNSDVDVRILSEWYQQNMEKDGWKITISPADMTSPIQQIEFQKNFITINVSLVKHSDTNEITVDYRPGPVTEDEGSE